MSLSYDSMWLKDQIYVQIYLIFMLDKFVHNGKYQKKVCFIGNINAFSGVPKVWNWDKCEWLS